MQLVMWAQQALPLNEKEDVWVAAALSTSDAAWIHYQKKTLFSLSAACGVCDHPHPNIKGTSTK